MKSTANESNLVQVKVWDLFIRIFHWLLAVLIVVMLVSANFGYFDIHITTGKTIVILVIARLVWGIVGSSNARITALVFKPSAYINYIKTLPQRKPGYSLAHSPIGSLAVIAILGFLVFQLTTGLFAADVDGLVEGPFAYYISYELSRTASDLHLQNVDWLISIIVLHIAANLFYYFFCVQPDQADDYRQSIRSERQVPRPAATCLTMARVSCDGNCRGDYGLDLCAVWIEQIILSVVEIENDSLYSLLRLSS